MTFVSVTAYQTDLFIICKKKIKVTKENQILKYWAKKIVLTVIWEASVKPYQVSQHK